MDYDNRTASVRVAGVVDETVGPLRNAVTGDPIAHCLQLPNGFEFTEAEVAKRQNQNDG